MELWYRLTWASSRDGLQVAIKRLSHTVATWKECVALPEVVALKQLQHPNIVRLLSVVREVNGSVHLVFDAYYDSLLSCISTRRARIWTPSFSVAEIRSIMWQLLKVRLPELR